jgi:dienelactone hydrolase
MMRRFTALAVVIGLAGAGLVGCDRASPVTATIAVDRPTALVDEPVRITISGLRPGAAVVVSAESDDGLDQRWRSEVTVTADSHGVVDLGRAAATSGSHAGIDGMDLFSFMDPLGANADESFYFMDAELGGWQVRLAVAMDGAEVARTTVRRVMRADTVTQRWLTIEDDGMVGLLYQPPAGARRLPAVLLLGGSDGSYGLPRDAALLASRGHPALSLAYFGSPGLPDELREIPLEYFAEAARRLAREASVNGPVAVIGYSRGTEAALLTAQHFPDLVRGVVLYAPSDRIIAGFPNGGAAWTHRGRAVPYGPIPVGRVDGPVLTLAGTADLVWPAAPSARAIERALDAAAPDVEHTALVYEGAGHFVGTYPFTPLGVATTHPVTGAHTESGGTRAANERARRDGWPRVLALLGSLG